MHKWKHASPKKLSTRKRGLGRFAVLSCLFWDNVLCSRRKSSNDFKMDICSECSHFLRFEHEMDEEDERVNIEIDEEMRKGSSA